MNFGIYVAIGLAIYVVGIFISIPIMVWYKHLDVFKPCLESNILDDYVEYALKWPFMLICFACCCIYNAIRYALTATIICAYDIRHKKDGAKDD